VKRALVVLGGLRMGDCLHMIPYLSHIKKEVDRITWITGSYEADVANLISKYIEGIEVVVKPDGTPQNISDRVDFIKKYTPSEEVRRQYDKVLCDPQMPFDQKPNVPFTTIKTQRNPQDYILVNENSLNAQWKKVSIQVPDDVRAVRIDRWLSFQDLVSLALGAKCIISTHGFLACFAFYFDIPLICLHFCEGLFRFSDYRSRIVDYPGKALPGTECNRLLKDVLKGGLS
jgi:hypothetical protein